MNKPHDHQRIARLLRECNASAAPALLLAAACVALAAAFAFSAFLS
ncbi:MAG TPA: hypothetical protein VLD35_07225 [Caldimonas sp.]|nr:hypothetical protein [Caldimonas sp.]